VVIVNHGSRFFTVYGQLSERFREKGDSLKAGEVIGRLGPTASGEGPKLYFEIRRAGNQVDPLKWVKVH
jgi:septal ring factor EnvC (AmiA/AmiB activator)